MTRYRIRAVFAPRRGGVARIWLETNLVFYRIGNICFVLLFRAAFVRGTSAQTGFFTKTNLVFQAIDISTRASPFRTVFAQRCGTFRDALDRRFGLRLRQQRAVPHQMARRDEAVDGGPKHGLAAAAPQLDLRLLDGTAVTVDQ